VHVINEIEEILDEIRPYMRLHSGGVEVVEVDECCGIVKVRLAGACASCPLAEITLKGLVETVIKERAEWVKEVIAVKDICE